MDPLRVTWRSALVAGAVRAPGRVIQASLRTVCIWRAMDWARNYHGSMNGMGGFRVWVTRLADLRAGARPSAFDPAPEAARLRSPLQLHHLCVHLSRQRL